MIRIPKSLSKILVACATDEGRYAMKAIRIQEFKNDHYRIDATDGKMAVVVTGESEAANYGAGLPAPDEDARFDYLVDADEMDKAFRLCPKGGAIAIQADRDGVFIAVGQTVTRLDINEGRFPDVDMVLPKDKNPIARFRMNPAVLIRALEAAKGMELVNNTVEFFVYASDKPVAITGLGEKYAFDSIVMPCS